MARFTADTSRKFFEEHYFSKQDKKEKKKLESKADGSIWDAMTKKTPDSKPPREK